MELNCFFKSVLDSETSPVVICDLSHTVVYMNPSAIKRYRKNLVGNSIKGCHNSDSNSKIDRVVEWFKLDENNNKLFTYWDEKENKDIYMVALRDDNGQLMGYYEKHEYREREKAEPYNREEIR